MNYTYTFTNVYIYKNNLEQNQPGAKGYTRYDSSYINRQDQFPITLEVRSGEERTSCCCMRHQEGMVI